LLRCEKVCWLFNILELTLGYKRISNVIHFRFVDERLLGETKQKLENALIKPKERIFFELKDFESNLIRTRLILNRNQLIKVSSAAFLNFQGRFINHMFKLLN